MLGDASFRLVFIKAIHRDNGYRANKIVDPSSQWTLTNFTEGSRSRCAVTGAGGFCEGGGKADLEHNAVQCRGN